MVRAEAAAGQMAEALAGPALQVYSDWRNLPTAARGAAIGLGNFDGVHAGHRAVLAAAQASGAGPLGAAVFAPHPRRFFQPQAPAFRLTSDAFRARLLAAAGAARLYVLPFDRDLSLMAPERFATEVLAEGLGIAHVAVGADYRFGRDRAGDVETLATLGGRLGFGVSVAADVTEGEAQARVSSTAIRAALGAGDPERATALLGRPFVIDGVVERGDQRGRTIGFPTANVALGDLLRPRFGVYAVRARLDGAGDWRDGVANLGRRPTVGGEVERLEVHVFGDLGDVYGRRIEVALLAFLRPEQRFEGLPALAAQIARDRDDALARLAALPPETRVP